MGGIFVWFKRIVEMEDGIELTKSTLMEMLLDGKEDSITG
jgi:hypothetical protein